MGVRSAEQLMSWTTTQRSFKVLTTTLVRNDSAPKLNHDTTRPSATFASDDFNGAKLLKAVTREFAEMVDGLAPLRALGRAASTSMEFVTGRRPSADLSTYRKKASPAVKAGQSFEVSDHGRKAESYETLVQDIKDVNTDLDGTPQALVVHLLSATRLPRLHQLNRSSISPFVVMWAIDHRGRVVGEKATWAPRRETREPVWNCAHDLKLPPMPYKELKRSLLHVELWDHDMLLPPNPIGQVRLGCFQPPRKIC